MGSTERCPACGSAAIPIMFGLPAPAAVQAADDGKLVLGGCIVHGEVWQCSTDPAHRWGDAATDFDDPRHTKAVNEVVEQYL